MRITVDRFYSDEDATLSRILLDGEFICFGLEDEYREHKIAGETRIPSGIYQVGLRTVGGFHERYNRKYDFHEGMLWVQDVPNFEYILIHTGNTDEHTAGCLLVGETAQAIPGDLKVLSSVNAYKRLYPLAIEAAKNKNLTIKYIDNDL